ncbi:ATP-binding protein [Myroides pelagicus]|uniref:sensor histidine kinase n=1 Tax=Myroides pelagicus TaxID=270914 RepID=UPI002DBDCB35|nr:ATP-binding protein [Myroides pelagicus]MEC4114182.1 ATP-binding protein [Myroides pelagicus]
MLTDKKNEQILNLLIENNAIEHKAIVQERLRISKDLHDSVVNSVFALRFNVQQLQVEDQQMKQSLVNELSNLEATVRGISHSLVKNNIVNNGFEQLLSDLVERQINPHNTKFTLQIDKDLPLSDLSIQQKANIYHILQEALQNVNKHAQANKCEVSIKSYHDQILFKVSDNGKGIQKNQLYKGIGIQNMHERADHIEPELTISSVAGKYTQVSLIV